MEPKNCIPVDWYLGLSSPAVNSCEEVQKSYGVLSMIDTLKATLVPVMGAKVPLCNDFVEGYQAIWGFIQHVFCTMDLLDWHEASCFTSFIYLRAKYLQSSKKIVGYVMNTSVNLGFLLYFLANVLE